MSLERKRQNDSARKRSAFPLRKCELPCCSGPSSSNCRYTRRPQSINEPPSRGFAYTARLREPGWAAVVHRSPCGAKCRWTNPLRGRSLRRRGRRPALTRIGSSTPVGRRGRGADLIFGLSIWSSTSAIGAGPIACDKLLSINQNSCWSAHHEFSTDPDRQKRGAARPRPLVFAAPRSRGRCRRGRRPRRTPRPLPPGTGRPRRRTREPPAARDPAAPGEAPFRPFAPPTSP